MSITPAKIEQLTKLFKTAKIHSALSWEITVGHEEIDADEMCTVLEEVFNVLGLEPPEEPTDAEITETEEEGY